MVRERDGREREGEKGGRERGERKRGERGSEDKERVSERGGDRRQRQAGNASLD